MTALAKQDAASTAHPLLQQLRDFHAPETISGWPPAPGWWILSLLLLAGMCALIWYARQRYRRNAWRREALHQLARIQASPFDPHDSKVHAQISQLLKQCLASRCNDLQQARSLMALTGDNWANALRASSRVLTPHDIHLFVYAQYKAEPPPLEAGHLRRVALWIRSLPA